MNGADLGAEAFAQAFARVYLTWDARHPAARQRELARFGTGIAQDAGAMEPHSSQDVAWSMVSGDVMAAGGRSITVATQTTHGVVDLSVIVGRDSAGRLYLAGSPALVGAVPVLRTPPDVTDEPVEDRELIDTVKRAVRAYLAGDRSALAADLAPGARVTVPEPPASVEAVDDVSWGARGVVAVALRARLASGAVLELGYRLGVERLAGRWFVSWIQTPTGRDT